VGGYDPASEAITWTGAVSAGLPVTLTFQVTVDLALADGAVVTNTVAISDGAGLGFERVATATVSLPPFIESTYPADGETAVLITAPLAITFSEPVVTATLLYTVTPDPGGWSEAWSAGDTVVTLDHDDLAYMQVYTVAVTAVDLEGQSLAPGPVPNPWSFTTAGRSTVRVYLPVVVRDY
jgi:hypothetical protein